MIPCPVRLGAGLGSGRFGPPPPLRIRSANIRSAKSQFAIRMCEFVVRRCEFAVRIANIRNVRMCELRIRNANSHLRIFAVRLFAKDVNHSFNMPVMRITQAAIPGSEIRILMEAKKTGKFDLACAQLCGLGHFRMRGEVHIETAEQFDAWLKEQQAAAEEEEGDFVF